MEFLKVEHGAANMIVASEPKVAIFVDSYDAKARRYCYWIDYLERVKRPYTLIAIPELRRAVVERQERALPRLDQYDVIILNWDVANGDLAWLADETLEFFQNRGRDEIRRWSRKGARVVIEIQSAGGYPLQELYDAILGHGEVEVSPQGKVDAYLDKETIIIENSRRRKHPVLDHSSATMGAVFSEHRPFNHVIFPGFDKSEESAYARNKRALSFGNFTDWSRDWFPIFLRSGADVSGKERMPVALVKRVGDNGGELIATTMRIANSHNAQLIEGFLWASKNSRKQLADFYHSAERARDYRRFIEIIALWIIGIFCFVPLSNFLGNVADEMIQAIAIRQLNAEPFLLEYISNFRVSDATIAAVIYTLFLISKNVWKRKQGA